jgi:uncharacterized DUF497 family protein
MEVCWDPKKAKINYLKHQILFSDAEAVLYDVYAISCQDLDVEDERFVVTGCDSLRRVLTIVYAYRE